MNRMMATLACVPFYAAAPVFAAPAYDNHALSGTYHSVEAESYWSNGQFPKGFSLTINLTFAPNQLDYASVNDTMKDRLYKNNFQISLDDKVGPLADNARFNEIRIRQLGPREFQVLEQKNGDVIVGQYWRFSDDGKKLIRWGVGKAPDGQSKAFLETFVRMK